ncbi:F0F1 ATP synthase subunit delta [Bacteroides sp. 224]|uniref:F0F1 ATP synthase subunit delta n=1 Tax=Bacteroides sp. 224 TaxID=2302936 RepID=UPI0013D1927C|nr:F0F1 ATP synthase subunit delta [Bacteroides sp. 224]NDV65153.1 F0F1 ATP synthase subunit delta [Bacteroides sp. 224]
MDIGAISRRYAKALIGYAVEKGAEDTVYQEFIRLSKSFSKFPKLRIALENPILSRKDKLELISAAANGEEKSSDVFIRFMELVLKHRREVYLHFMCRIYLDLYRSLKHIGNGTLITAVPVDKDIKERIRSAAGAVVHAEMELQTIVDPSIGGGFVFDINDYRLDASVVTQLKMIKQQLIEKNKRIV